MPVVYALQSEVLQLIATGRYEPADLTRQFVAGLSDPACPATVSLLIDVRESEVLAGRTPEQIREAAEFLKPYAERIGRRCAVVVSRDAQYGLARMGSVFCGLVGVEANVFRTLEEAMLWLNAAGRERES